MREGGSEGGSEGRREGGSEGVREGVMEGRLQGGRAFPHILTSLCRFVSFRFDPLHDIFISFVSFRFVNVCAH